jgi:hypothetical protein
VDSTANNDSAVVVSVKNATIATIDRTTNNTFLSQRFMLVIAELLLSGIILFMHSDSSFVRVDNVKVLYTTYSNMIVTA